GPALSLVTKQGLLRDLRAAAADARVRAVVLTGTGKAFCVGQDLAEHAAALESDAASAMDTVDEHYNPIATLLATMPKPVVAAVSWGLAADLVPAAEVRATAAAVAAGLAAGPTAAYAETKRLLADAPSRPLAQSLQAESAAQRRLSLTADHAGAVRAFLAK